MKRASLADPEQSNPSEGAEDSKTPTDHIHRALETAEKRFSKLAHYKLSHTMLAVRGPYRR